MNINFTNCDLPIWGCGYYYGLVAPIVCMDRMIGFPLAVENHVA